MQGKLNISSQNKLLAGSFLIFIVLFFTLNHKNNKKSESENFYADTLIPKGQVLVPIELSNIAALSSLINQYAVIDLYGGNSQENSVQIASRIKIIRAPLNPNQYAVLVDEALSKEIMKYRGPFWASIQSRNSAAPNYDLSKIEASISNNKKLNNPQLPNTKKSRNSFKNIEIEYYKNPEDL